MGEIETMMRKSVRAITEEGIQQYKTTKRGDFVLGHAAMVVLAVTQHYWTIEVEAAMEEAGCDGVKAYLEKMLGQMKELTQLVRTKLTKLQSKTMAALIVMEVRAGTRLGPTGRLTHTHSPTPLTSLLLPLQVHARDVVEKLVAASVSRKGDFEWVSQLRFYWEESPSYLGDTNLLVRMVQVTGCHCHHRHHIHNHNLHLTSPPYQWCSARSRTATSTSARARAS